MVTGFLNGGLGLALALLAAIDRRPGAVAEDTPAVAKPDAVGAREEGRQACRAGKNADDNPYAGPGGDKGAAREWLRGLLDEGERVP